MTHSDAGKGSTRRPTDQQRYATNYDTIFGTKTRRGITKPIDEQGHKKPAELGETLPKLL